MVRVGFVLCGKPGQTEEIWRNGEGLVAGRLVLMADWCLMAFENGDGLMAADVSMAVENDGGQKVVEVGAIGVEG